METTDQVEIRLGLPERYRYQAAELYYEAFRQKFEPIMRSLEHGAAILAKDLVPELVIAALYQDQLVGAVGLQYRGRVFVKPRISSFVHQFGWPVGLVRFMFFLLFAWPEHEQDLIIEAIAVHASMRRKGVGTQLLQAVFDFARTNRCRSVCLDVVDTNLNARHLYERLGFVPTKTRQYPYLQRIMGFSAVTTMVKQMTW